MGQGYLTVDVKTANGVLPVAGADVIISDQQGRALWHLLSGPDGKTDEVELYAPDKATTLEPGGEAYAKYNVTVQKEGYTPLFIEGAKVLDTIASTQPAILHPAYPGSEPSEILDLAEIALKEDPPQIEQEGPPVLGRTVADVIIPARITVHMGTPASGARNITVPFTDYIKNVTASEIYATWPPASLQANIYAIISLTLNRVFTEWYRVQGFNFDITNSTQYDQYFVEGQTIPNNISQLVDQMFNSYIRRVGHREPLFASYCNGTTATCSGLSQWGTVSLANAGYSPVNILRHYYGTNIEIVQTNTIADIVSSFPGFSLSQGSSGSSVARMQTYLNRIATNYPAIPKSDPNGQFGSATAVSVRTFQRVFNLPQTGVINQATWNKISYIYLAVTKLAELASEGQRIGLGASPPTSILRTGSRGGDVVQLQFLLNAIGFFFSGIPTPLLEDGSFGPTTDNAVRAFQRQFSLSPDGVVGPATWRKLYEVYQSLGLDTVPGEEPEIPPFPGTILRIGSRGTDVEFIQGILNALSSIYPAIPTVFRDGIYGPLTAAQVTAFQREFGLPVTGEVGPATWEAIMNANFFGQTPAPPSPPPTQPEYPGYVLQEGAVGQSVTVLQLALNRMADEDDSIPRPAVDGIFGPVTAASVMAAQQALGLTPDGIVGQVSWNAIVRGETTPAPQAPPWPGTLLRQGSRGENVRTVQTHINNLAAVNASVPRVTVDGIFGPRTHAAVVAAQRALGLTPDGIVGPITWNALVLY